MSATSASDEELSHEYRLGLVLYGGVSLAIYIYGVADEFFRAVRGRGVFSLLKALTDFDIIVDVISGTSAGGINGIFLASAISNHGEFSCFADLWREHGDIANLLRDPAQEPCDSLLDSEGYYQPRLQEAFAGLQDHPIAPGRDRFQSPIQELDLFITGTDVQGTVTTHFDDAGHPLDVKDHRTVFLLKHREGRSEPFNPAFSPDKQPVDEQATYSALAKLARITSCFPAAFSPVHLSIPEKAKPVDPADEKLRYWGAVTKEAYYVDGGVLDNKPFTHTIREIFHRTAHRLTSRFLVYVEPDPVQFDKAAKAEKPDIFKAVIDSLTSIPGYESIADDLALLEEHNDRVEQHRCLTRELDVPAGATQVGNDVVAALYRNSRLNQIARRAATGLLREKGRARPLTDPRHRRAAAELIAGFSELVSRLDETSPGGWEAELGHFDVYFRLRRLFHCSYDIRERIKNRAADAEEVPRLIELRKAINCQITLLEIVRHQMEALVDQADIVRWDTVKRLLGDESDPKSRLDKVEEIWKYLSEAYDKLLDVRSFDGSGALPPDGYGERWQQEEPAPWLDAETLKGFRERLVARRRSLEARISDRDPDALSIPDPTSTDPTNLLHVADAQEEAMFSYFADEIGGPAQEVFALYQRFAYIDAHLFPMERLSGLESKDYIRTVRFSPRDAKCGFSNKSLEEKLSGDAVHHFGGFFKRSWRANDILWGRLDGVCQLTETLLGQDKKDRLRVVMGDSHLRDKVGKRVLDPNSRTGFVTGLAPQEIFPHAGSQTHRALGDYIRSFVAGSLDAAQLGEMKELLVEAAQLEIIYESLGDIVADAVKEQLEWNRFRLPEEKRQALREQAAHVRWDFADSTFVPGDGDLDPLVTSVAARAAAENAVREFRNAPTESASRPQETALGKEFERYRVGSEELTKDVPRIILLQVLANALLVLRNCVVTALGERGFDTGSIKKNRFYRWGISLPLYLFRFLVLRKRANPHEGWLPPGAVILVSVVLLSLGGVALNRGADVSILMALLLLLLPAVGLAYGLRALWIRKFKRATWVQRLFRFVVLLIVLVAVGLVGYYFGFLFQKILMAGLTTWELASATLPIILLTVLVVWAGSWLWTKIQTDPTEAKS